MVTSVTAKCYPHGVARLESRIQAIATDPAIKGGDDTAQPEDGLSASGLVWAPWLLAGVMASRVVEGGRAPRHLAQPIDSFRHGFIPNGDANDIIFQMRTWEHHHVAGTPGFGGDTERALRSFRVPGRRAKGSRGGRQVRR